MEKAAVKEIARVPKQVKLSKGMAKAVKDSMVTVNSLALAAQAAQKEYTTAQVAQERFLGALITDAGFDPNKDFPRFGLWEDPSGETFLRAQEDQK